MIKQIQILYWTGITTIILLAVSSVSVFLLASLSSPAASSAQAAETNNITGWAWMGNAAIGDGANYKLSNAGWISLNAQNCTKLNELPNPDPCITTAGVDYGLKLTFDQNPNPTGGAISHLTFDQFDQNPNPTGGAISGMAWHGPVPAAGRLCNSGSNKGNRCTTNSDCPGGSCVAPGAWGWICFGSACQGKLLAGDRPPGNQSLDITFYCEDVTGPKGTPDGTPDCNETVMAPVNGGWAKILAEPKGRGWISLSSKNCDSNSTNFLCTDKRSYGLTVDLDNSKIEGYAWQTEPVVKLCRYGANNGSACINNTNCPGGTCSLTDAYGAGWICFGGSCNVVDIIFPYLRVEGGDVFSLKGIQTYFPAPRDIRNAQYLVHVGENASISSRFSTQCELQASDPVCRLTGVKLNLSPASDTGEPYNFKLGRFDFLGLAKQVNNNLNRYNHEVVQVPIHDINSIFSHSLNNKVYVVGDMGIFNSSYATPGKHVVLGATEIQNGAGKDSGAGTVIVLGDLHIEGNVNYASMVGGSVTRQNLASVVWIVLGDVIVNPAVKQLAGNFIILGHRWNYGTAKACLTGNNIGLSCIDNSVCGRPPALCGLLPKCRVWQADNKGLFDGCGIFQSGDDSTSPTSLTVLGTVFARQFNLTRIFTNPADPGEASEKFIADGRLQLNPPPGMTDFAKGLPTFSRQ